MSTESVTTRAKYRNKLQGGLAQLYLIYRRLPLASKVSVWLLTAIGLSAVLAPYVLPYDPNAPNYANTLAYPTLEHPMGTDNFGRDVFTRVVYGGRISLTVAVASVALALAIGVPLGSVAGYWGGWTDDVMMRFVDTIFAFPTLILALGIIAVTGPSLTNVILVIGIVYSPQYARLVRGEVLSVKQDLYVEAARGLGYSRWRILLKEVLPNSFAPVVVQATFHLATAMLTEAGLSFLGLGVRPPTPSWGNMIREGEQFLPDVWWIAIFPGLMIMIAVIAINFVGDAIHDQFDPRSTSETLD